MAIFIFPISTNKNISNELVHAFREETVQSVSFSSLRKEVVSDPK